MPLYSKTAYPEPPQANSYFVNFLHDLLLNPSLSHVIEWNAAGTMFRINNWDILKEQIFPNYFKCKWSSFMKYFVFYEFRRQDGYIYRKYFTRDDAQLDKIKKRPKKQKAPGDQWPAFNSVGTHPTMTVEADRNCDVLQREPALPLPAALPATPAPTAEPIIGYTHEGQYHPLSPNEKACFFVDGRFVNADTSNIHIYVRHPNSRPCIYDGSKHMLVNGAQFHAVDPRPQSPTCYRVLGYLQDDAWVHLMPEDLVVYWYKGLWCSVLTQTDVKLAQHSDARVYVVHDGEYFMLEPGTLLYVRPEMEALEPTVVAKEGDMDVDGKQDKGGEGGEGGGEEGEDKKQPGGIDEGQEAWNGIVREAS